MNNYCVYKHTSPSGKVYVGITKLKPKYRWNNGKGYTRGDGALGAGHTHTGWHHSTESLKKISL